MAVKGVNPPTLMSTSAPQYSYAGRESRTGGSDEDGDLDDIIEQIKMACRPASAPKEERESDYDTDIEDKEPSKTPFDQYGRRTYNRTCRKLGVNPISAVAKELDTDHLSVCHRGLSEHEVLAIANALLDNTSVTTITLEGNMMSDKGCQYICLALAENVNVTTLSLRNNKLCGKCALLLAELLEENETLKNLDVSENNFLDVDAVHFQRILLDSRHLQELNLSHNNLGDEAAKLLGSAIGKNDFLRVLDLSWNVIRPPGALHICKGLEENVILHSINLAYNGLANSGAMALANVLKENTSLVELDITCNRIYDEGAYVLSKALQVNESLKVLKASQNPITDLGALAIMGAIHANETSAMTCVDMASIHVYHKTVALSRQLNQQRPGGFCFLHGQVMDEILKVKEAAADSEESPLLLLQWYVDLKAINLLDVFKDFKLVADQPVVSREDFKAGLKSIKAPLTDQQVTQLMDSVDDRDENTVHLNAITNAARKKEKTVIAS